MTGLVKMYNCQLCGFFTARRDAFMRHQNSKKHIHARMQTSYHNSHNTILPSENVTPISENVTPISENVTPISENVVRVHGNVTRINENVTLPSENVIRDSETVIQTTKNVKYTCQKCNKAYQKKEYLKSHEQKCTGIDSLTCSTCMKTFANRHTKSRHCKRNNCKPVSIFEAENVKSIINNNASQSYNNHSLNTNNTTNNNNNNTNNITKIYINDYGKERKDYLLAYDNFYDIIRVPNNNILVKYLKCKNFNPLFPENHCIKYENKCFKLKENNRWNLINPNALKDKLFFDCGSEVLQAFDNNEDKIRKDIDNSDYFDAVKRKTSFLQLQIEGHDHPIKSYMIDIVKDVKHT